MTVGVVNNWGNLGVTGTITPDAIVTSELSTTGVVSSTLRIGLNTPPSSATDPGQPGEIIIAPGFIYICVEEDTWERVATATW